MLRLQPQSPATPTAPVVVMFDHPMAPRLEESIDPARVLRIVPAVGAHVYWRDPSTIVADFDSVWTAGARYEVRLDPALRSAKGLSLAGPRQFVVHVRMPRALAIRSSATESEADTLARPVAAFDGAFDLALLERRMWFVPYRDCGVTDSLALRAVRMRRIALGDAWEMTEAGGYDRDRRLDSLRRVVEFEMPRMLPRGCRGDLRLPKVLGDTARHRVPFGVRPPFQFTGVVCDGRPWTGPPLPQNGISRRECPRGALSLRFSNPVAPEEIRAHVLVDGRPARMNTEYVDVQHYLGDSIGPLRTTRITVQSTLRNTHGEELGRDSTLEITGKPLSPSVGYLARSLLVPRNAPSFLRVRHVNTDSVVVVMSRVPDSLRSKVLTGVQHSYDGDALRWKSVVRDTVVLAIATPAPANSEQIVDVPTSSIPVAWRNDPLLLVRAMPEARPARRAVSAPPSARERGLAHQLPSVDIISSGGDLVTPIAIVQRSDIAVQMVGATGTADVWVTSLRGGEPRAGAIVSVRDDSMHTYASAVTDARGGATLNYTSPRNERTLLHIEAALDDDRTLLMLTPPYDRHDDVVDEDSLDVHTWYGSTTKIDARWLHGSAYTERGIYRPGERVYLGGAVRTFTPDSGYRTPSADSARWSIWHTGERLWSRAGRLSEFGALADSFALSRTARPGYYIATLALRTGNAWRTAARTTFSVAEYRAPEFAVHVEGDATPLFVGDTAHVRVDARYLFGLPMAGGSVSWWWNEYPGAAPRVPALERYTVGRSGWQLSLEAPDTTQRMGHGNAVLAADGTFLLNVPTLAMNQPGDVSVNVTVTDASRQTVTSQFTTSLNVADAHVGVRTKEPRWVWNARDPIAVELMDVRTNGTPRVGDSIAIAAVRLRWVKSQVVRDTVWRTTLTSRSTPVSLTFRPQIAGSYELLASVVDERGRRAITGLDVWVVGRTGSWARSDPRALTLRSDRTRYAPGDTVSLVVESPAEQRAWVSVRREGNLYERIVALHAGINALSIPMPANAAPRVNIHVIAVRPFGTVGSDSAGIYYRTGSLSIEVEERTRALRVAIVPDRQSYRPGDSVRVTVDVRDAKGKAKHAQATVWAVDEGVVSLTAFEKPDVLRMLMGTGPEYSWMSSTMLAWMLTMPPDVWPAYSDVLSRMMLGSSASSSAFAVSTAGLDATTTVRRQFATSPFYSGDVRTDATGRATVTFKLPDNVGTFHLYAAAVGDDVYAGSADTTIVSTRPLLVRAALPRVVRVGDTLLAGAVLTQEATSRTPVSLDISTKNLRVAGPSTLFDTLDAQHAREMRFPVTVTGGDSVEVVFRGTATGAAAASDAVDTHLAVSPPGRARAHVVTGMFDRAADVSLAIPDGTDTLRSHVALQFGVSALPLVRQYSEALRIYPYYCTEQLASAGRALLARLSLQRALGDTAALNEGERARLETTVNVLVARQRADGGYGYWSALNWTSGWLTAYAYDFLLGARDIGIAVPARSLEHAKKYMAEAFPRTLRTGDDPWFAWRDSVAWPHNAMASAALLRRAGVGDTSLENDLWTMRNRLDFEDRLSLAQVFAASGDTAKANQLMDAAWRSARVEGRRVTLDDSAAARHWIFRSTARPIAQLLATTARLQPNHPLLGALFESLVQVGRSDRSAWWNTLDQATVAEALTAAALAMELNTARPIVVSGPRGKIANVVVGLRGADSLLVPVSQLAEREGKTQSLHMKLASPSNTPTYFAMTLFEVPTARPVRADDGGIGVERWYESYDGGKPITEVREGELVRVRLRITVPADREFVVVDDALPAGLEAVDLSLRTSASLPPFPGAPRLTADMQEGSLAQRYMYGAWDGGWWTPWEHKEIRDDRVLYFARQLWKGSYQASYVARATTAGTFVRPPAQAEEMYNPAIHGRSDGGTFTVIRAPR